jgi:hypothetical protein
MHMHGQYTRRLQSIHGAMLCDWPQSPYCEKPLASAYVIFSFFVRGRHSCQAAPQGIFDAGYR